MPVDGALTELMSREERDATVKELLALQHPDGGWSLPSLGSWMRQDGTPNDPKAPSDGYGTGFVTFTLLQAGLARTDPVILRAVSWLNKNQRESGRWWTHSLNTETYHFISHTGTAYAALALKAVEATSAN
jgi:squalene-hopene/tetraprenyl-beta-curcumene cyclase